MDVIDEQLSDTAILALAWQPTRGRAALSALFSLDGRLARLVAQNREPLLGQIRLAWWREQIGGTAAPASGDPALDLIRANWGQDAATLLPLVHGWEELLSDAPLAADSIDRFAAGRGAAIAAFAAHVGAPGGGAMTAGKRWALADFAARTSHQEERDEALRMARAMPPPGPLPRDLRGIAVIETLAARAVAAGRPMLAGRADALVAWRVGTTGR